MLISKKRDAVKPRGLRFVSYRRTKRNKKAMLSLQAHRKKLKSSSPSIYTSNLAVRDSNPRGCEFTTYKLDY
jgi:hypothetical protein